MLGELQQSLHDIYRLGPGYDVRDFVVTDRALATILGPDAMLANTDETLLLAEDDQGLAMSLFLEAGMLERLHAADPLKALRPEQLDDLWKVLEGVSHFTCVAWKAARDRKVSLLELELQGEVDKFVGTMLLALAQGNTELSSRLHGWLFDEVSFHEELDDDALARYRTANDIAARYCHGLARRLVDNDAAIFGELRHFYRLPLTEKITHTRSRVFAG